ncbi:MAG: imidazole glycerol phosphate synthase subunit HisF [archaeon]
MPLAKRIIPCLDVESGKVVKGIHFQDLKRAGDPVELAQRYCDSGADELVFLDITASPQKRRILKDVVENVALATNIPFTVGGGLRSISDARLILCSGADKVSVNTAAVEDPSIVKGLAETFGTQCVVVSIDVKRQYDSRENMTMVETRQGTCWFEVYTYGGRKPTGIDAIQWAHRVTDLGAGELLITSMDKDGTGEGYDLELTRSMSERVNVPVIASGGAGEPRHFLEAFTLGKADAALAASVFHYDKYPIQVVKEFLSESGVAVRPQPE